MEIVTPRRFESLDAARDYLAGASEGALPMTQQQFLEAIAHLKMNDQQTEELASWIDDNQVEFVQDDLDSELEEKEELENGSMIESEIRALEESFARSSLSKINDPVKMYLKEIGQIPLLNAAQEKEIAIRIEAGDEEA
ncbi:MAG: RNA polymerase sigma factor RpoD, partial [Ileibacterium sp.]|nr:RNA polymerase sigma factor RpoD [Ileibacterium sp.]